MFFFVVFLLFYYFVSSFFIPLIQSWNSVIQNQILQNTSGSDQSGVRLFSRQNHDLFTFSFAFPVNLNTHTSLSTFCTLTTANRVSATIFLHDINLAIIRLKTVQQLIVFK